VVVNRTFRYQNPYFPWGEIVKHYKDAIMFVGLKHEYEAFCERWGNVEFRPCRELLEVAELIAACDLFIGNQSCANACAEGMKKNLIQETSMSLPDCIWRRGNAQHVINGACVLPSAGGHGELRLESKFKEGINPKKHVTPPGMWQMPNMTPNPSLSGIVELIFIRERRVRRKEEIEAEVLVENIRRLPDFFRDESLRCIFDTFHDAHSRAPS